MVSSGTADAFETGGGPGGVGRPGGGGVFCDTGPVIARNFAPSFECMAVNTGLSDLTIC